MIRNLLVRILGVELDDAVDDGVVLDDVTERRRACVRACALTPTRDKRCGGKGARVEVIHHAPGQNTGQRRSHKLSLQMAKIQPTSKKKYKFY